MNRYIFITALAAVFSFHLSLAQIDVSLNVKVAPPELPVYDQPPCPGDGYLWTPGYWAYSNDGYYWVPGVWVYPPEVGLLWTPPYWEFYNGVYRWHTGYWAENVGFYGGVNYGFGYGGFGFYGGRWEGRAFRYNTAVVNVNTTVVHNTYIDRTVINNTTINDHRSFNGEGGVVARPRPEDETASRERHIRPTEEQNSHHVQAAEDRSQFATVNHGRPSTTAMNSVQGTHFNQEGHKVETPQQHSVAEKPAAPEQHVERPANKPEPVQEEKNTQRTPERKAPTESNNHPATHDRELPAPEKPASHERPESHQPTPSKPVTAEHHNEQKPAMPHEAAPTPPQHHASAPARPQPRPQQRPKAQPPKPNHEKKN